MALKVRFFLLVLAVSALTGCGVRAFGSLGRVVEAVDTTTVTRTLQFVDGAEDGPVYNVSLTVPDAWVGQFETVRSGNNLTFNYVDGSRRAPVFYIEALSAVQYWEQNGSYPGPFVNLAVTPETYFIYYLPVDNYYSGLPEDTFRELSDLVPTIVRSFDAVPVE